jgi:hypothetical protein
MDSIDSANPYFGHFPYVLDADSVQNECLVSRIGAKTCMQQCLSGSLILSNYL